MPLGNSCEVRKSPRPVAGKAPDCEGEGQACDLLFWWWRPPMSKQILVPLDGSKEAEAILWVVQRVATMRDSVHLLHVLPSVPAPVGFDPTYVIVLQDQADAYLDVVRKRWLFVQKGVNVVRSGDPA